MPPWYQKSKTPAVGLFWGVNGSQTPGTTKKKAHFWHRVIEYTAESLHWSVMPGSGNQSGVVELVGYMIACSL